MVCCRRRVAAAVSVNGVVALPDPPCGQRSAVPYSAISQTQIPLSRKPRTARFADNFLLLMSFRPNEQRERAEKSIPHYYLLYRYISPPRTLLWASVETTSRVTLSRRRRTHAHLNAQLSCAYHPTPLRLSPEFNHKKRSPKGALIALSY